MRERELREHASCGVCGNPIGESALPVFWTVKLQQHGVRLDAVRRQTGLAQMLGGNAAIAMAMGPDEEMTIPLTEEVELTVCLSCATKLEQPTTFMQLTELAQQKEEQHATAGS